MQPDLQVQRLVQDGEQVVAFVRGSNQNSGNSKIEKLKALGIECREVDLKNREDVMDASHGIGLVFHLAAAYRTEHSNRDEFRLINVEGTRHLLGAAKKARVKRFVHCSTVGVQGEIENPPADENYRFKPGDHYQESKMVGERLAMKYFSEGLPGVVVRPVGIYGPGDTRFL